MQHSNAGFLKKFIIATQLLISGFYTSSILAAYTAGDIYEAAGNGTIAISSSINALATSVSFGGLGGLAGDGKGNLYISDYNYILKLNTSTGIITVVAGTKVIGGYTGDNGPATSANIISSKGITVDSSGNIYFIDNNHYVVRKVTASTGIITTVAGNGTMSNCLSPSCKNNVLATATGLYYSDAVAVDSAGNLYIASSGDVTIRKVSASTGIITTVAGGGTCVGAYNHPLYCGDNGPATSAIVSATGIAFDSTDNMYIADNGNNVIRKVTASTGIITTVAGNGTNGYSGDNGLASSAQLAHPERVVLDAAGNIYFSDYVNYRLRKVSASTGIITTVAGNGTSGFSGDNGPATSAEIEFSSGDIAIDSVGNLYFSDFNKGTVRMVYSIGQPAGTTLNFVTGWNLVGNSVNAPLTVATAFSSTTNVSTVWKWEPTGTNTSISYPAWAFYAPSLSTTALATYAASKGYDVLTTINAGEGFWVNAKAAFTASLPSGTAIASSAFADQSTGANSLPQGWSLIATGDNPTPRSFVNTIALTQPLSPAVAATSISTLWAWDSVNTNWYFYAPSLDNSSGLANYITTKSYEDFTAKSKTLDATTGFWVNHP